MNLERVEFRGKEVVKVMIMPLQMGFALKSRKTVFHFLLDVDCSNEVNSNIAIYTSSYQFRTYGVLRSYSPSFYIHMFEFFFCTRTSFRILMAAGCRIKCFLMVSLVRLHVPTLPRKLIKLLIKSQFLSQMVLLALRVHMVLRQQMNHTVAGGFPQLLLNMVLLQIKIMTHLLGTCVKFQLCMSYSFSGLVSIFFFLAFLSSFMSNTFTFLVFLYARDRKSKKI